MRWLAIPTLLLGIVAILSPVLVRSTAGGGSSLLTTSSAGINFYIGNRVGALGAYEELPWLEASDPQTEAQRYRQEAERRLGQNLTLEQASRYWFAQGMRDIAHHPGAWLRTLTRKFWLTIQDGEIRTNLGFAAVKSFCPIARILPLTWGFLLALAIAGLFLCWPWSREMKLLGPYLVAYLLVCMVFFSASEYRFPMILALLPLAGGFLVGIFRALQGHRFLRVVAALGVYLIVLVVANFPSKLRSELTAPAMDFYNLGCEAVNRDQIDKSIPLFTRALAEKPDFREVHLELARSLWQVGNFDDARREFELAGMAPPDSLLGTPLNQVVEEARALYEEGRCEEALSLMEKRIPAPGIVPIEVLALRADILERLGRYDEATSLYIRISERDSRNPEWPYHAALTARQGGDSVTCDSLLMTALGIYPAFAPARLELAENALSRGDTATAITQLAELRRIRIPVDSIRIRVQDLAKRVAARGNDE
jgi:tetratricopeptide (TPR) repeat protein